MNEGEKPNVLRGTLALKPGQVFIADKDAKFVAAAGNALGEFRIGAICTATTSPMTRGDIVSSPRTKTRTKINNPQGGFWRPVGLV